MGLRYGPPSPIPRLKPAFRKPDGVLVTNRDGYTAVGIVGSVIVYDGHESVAVSFRGGSQMVYNGQSLTLISRRV